MTNQEDDIEKVGLHFTKTDKTLVHICMQCPLGAENMINCPLGRPKSILLFTPALKMSVHTPAFIYFVFCIGPKSDQRDQLTDQRFPLMN